MEAAGYQGPADARPVEATEAMTAFPAGNEHPQGDKMFNGKTHQVFGQQFISKVEGGQVHGGRTPPRSRTDCIPTRRITPRCPSEP